MLKRGSQPDKNETAVLPAPATASTEEVEVAPALEPVPAPAAPLLTIVPTAEEESTDEKDDTDDLLSVFTTTGIAVEDRSLLVSMAGDIDIDDVVAELQLVAAALNLTSYADRDAA